MAPLKKHALDAEAADWLAKLQRDDLPQAQRAEFELWLQSDPAHAVAFARTEHAWERAQRLRALPGRERILPIPRRALFRSAIAAGAVTALVAAWMFLKAPENTYATGTGEHRTVSLPDGSRIDLNTSSRIEVDFTPQRRIVRLAQGEALFKVARDPRRPFVVQAADTAVKVLGTEFNVRLRRQLVEVTVSQGLVSVDDVHVAADSSVIVAAGELNRVPVDREIVRRRVAWRYGVIELKGETLEQAVEEFNRYSDDKLVVADPAIAGIRVGGRFETDESGKFLNALETGFRVRAIEAEDGRTYLFGRP